MKKLFAAILLVCSACASSQTPRPQTVADNNQAPQPSVVDMVQYAPVRPANQQAVDIRAIVGNDTARQAGALQVPMFEPNSRDAVRPFVTGPWRGTCLNEAAINHIAVSVNQTVGTVRADDFRTLEILGANAQRDISLLQSDINILRLAYEARVHSRDISLESANRTIAALQNNAGNSVYSNIGWTAVGVVGGMLLTGAIILFTR
jgi:hypothetical protein